MSYSVSAFPLQLRTPDYPASTAGPEVRGVSLARSEPVRYAYCLLDLAAEDARRPEHVYQADRFTYRQAMSERVVWQLTCRTNGQGFLVPVQHGPPDNPFLQNDEAAHRRIDREPALLVWSGMRFNLYWTYNKTLYLKALDAGSSLLQEEYLLHRCSTLFDVEQSPGILALHARLPNYPDLHRQHGGDAGWRAFMLNRFFRAPRWHRDPGGYDRYRRTVTRVAADGFSIKPEDEDLRRALELAGMIERALLAPAEHNVTAYLTWLDRILEILDRRGDEHSANDTIGLHNRIENLDPYQGYSVRKGRILRSFVEIVGYIDECGRRLAPLYNNAILQAISHYPSATARSYVSQLINMMGCYLARRFYEDVLSPQARFDVPMRILQEDRQPANEIEQLLRSYKDVQDSGLFGVATILEETTKWLDGMLGQVAAQRIEDVATSMNRLNQCLNNIRNPRAASGTARSVFVPNPSQQVVQAWHPERGPAGFLVHSGIQETAELLERMDKYMKAMNFILAFKELGEDPSFKNHVSAFSSTAEAARAFTPIRERVCNLFGLTETVVTRIGAAATVITAGIDAYENFSRGNNIAVLGNMLQAVSGIVLLLARGGVAGVAAAVLFVAGTVIVYYSLDADEKMLEEWNAVEASFREPTYVFLNYRETAMSSYDVYLQHRRDPF